MFLGVIRGFATLAVYFIEGPRGVKVGYSEDVAARLRQLQTGNATKLKILAVIPNGSRDIEIEFHRLFARWRLEGEWFIKNGSVMRTIALIRQGAAALLKEHLQLLAEYTQAPRETRIKMRPPTIVPEALRGTPTEVSICRLDAAIRADKMDQITLGKAHSALRRTLRGHEVDISFLDEYG
jgi:DNA-binding transcriptional ArsR family regulator